MIRKICSKTEYLYKNLFKNKQIKVNTFQSIKTHLLKFLHGHTRSIQLFLFFCRYIPRRTIYQMNGETHQYEKF